MYCCCKARLFHSPVIERQQVPRTPLRNLAECHTHHVAASYTPHARRLLSSNFQRPLQADLGPHILVQWNICITTALNYCTTQKIVTCQRHRWRTQQATLVYIFRSLKYHTHVQVDGSLAADSSTCGSRRPSAPSKNIINTTFTTL